MLIAPSGIFAATNCDSLAKPAFSCPAGYAIMCIPTGGDHWGCGRETPDGGIEETGSVREEPAADPVVAEPAPTTQEPASPAPTDPAPAFEPGTAQPVAASTASTPTSAPVPAPATTRPVAVTSAPQAEPAPVMPSGTSAEVPAEPIVMPLEEVREMVEAVADEAPAAVQPYLYAVAGALAMLIAVLGVQELLRRARNRNTHECAQCSGTGREEAAAGACENCEGKGAVEEEYEATAECAHCEGEGEDPCHVCGGAGESRNAGEDVASSCGACEGTGKRRDKDGENMECCTCAGEGEATATLKRDVACPDCDGVKRV